MDDLELQIIINIIISLVTGIITGSLATAGFFIVIHKLKPKVIISNDISYDQEQDLYFIKVVNLSRTILKNVRYSLRIFEETSDAVQTEPNGVTHRKSLFKSYIVVPHKSPVCFINKCNKKKENDEYNLNALRIGFSKNDQRKRCKFVGTDCDCDKIQNSNQTEVSALLHSFLDSTSGTKYSLEFTFYAESSASDSCVIGQKIYYPTNIKNKKFKLGNTIELED